jgi:hypothetical protein
MDTDEAATVVSWVPLDDGDVVLGARMIVARSRRDHTDVFHGRVAWVLRPSGSRFTIRVKRIDLLDADQPLPTITSVF